MGPSACPSRSASLPPACSAWSSGSLLIRSGRAATNTVCNRHNVIGHLTLNLSWVLEVVHLPGRVLLTLSGYWRLYISPGVFYSRYPGTGGCTFLRARSTHVIRVLEVVHFSGRVLLTLSGYWRLYISPGAFYSRYPGTGGCTFLRARSTHVIRVLEVAHFSGRVLLTLSGYWRLYISPGAFYSRYPGTGGCTFLRARSTHVIRVLEVVHFSGRVLLTLSGYGRLYISPGVFACDMSSRGVPGPLCGEFFIASPMLSPVTYTTIDVLHIE